MRTLQEQRGLTALVLLVAVASMGLASLASSAIPPRNEDNPYRHADLLRDYIDRFNRLFAEKRGHLVEQDDDAERKRGAGGYYGWNKNSPMIATPESQGQCGSCYVFAGKHAIQDLLAIQTNSSGPIDLSVQFPAACCPSCGSPLGYCYGGSPAVIGNFLLKNLRVRGLPNSECSPYTDYHTAAELAGFSKLASPSCSLSCSDDSSTFFSRPPINLAIPVLQDQNVDAIVAALQTGPVIVGIQLTESFEAWGRSNMVADVFPGPPYTWPDGSSVTGGHAVEIIGYVNATSPPYWIVKNSWSTDWGDNGFIYVLAGQNVMQIETGVFLSNGVFYNAFEFAPEYAGDYNAIAINDTGVTAAAAFFMYELGNASCSFFVTDALIQVQAGRSYRVGVTIVCPQQTPLEYVAAIGWDVNTSNFTVLIYELVGNSTYVPPIDPSGFSSSGSLMQSMLVFLFAALYDALCF
jgi:hypothetical protein